MNDSKVFLSSALAAALFAANTTAQAQTPPSWQAPYTGEEATGPNTIALWHFDGEKAGEDASGKGHLLTPRGKDTRFVADGKFGGALAVGEKEQPGDIRQGASTPDKDDLTPAGAFTIEMWFSPDENLNKLTQAYLLDKKYINATTDRPEANTDYMLLLRKAGENEFRVEAYLGFGTASEVARSTPQRLDAGQWYHLAFSYDGKGGVIFSLNGKRIGDAQWNNRGAISNGTQPLIIGDRAGSTGSRFAGRIDEVRLSNGVVRFVSGKVLADTVGARTAFYRQEKDARWQVRIVNDTSQPLQNAIVRLQAKDAFNQDFKVSNLAPGANTLVTVPINTELRPGQYEVNVTVENAGHKALGDTTVLPLTIVPRPLPHQMPVVLWAGSNTPEAVKDVGFSGYLVSPADYAQIWRDSNGPAMAQSRVTEMRETLDKLLAMQMAGYATLTPGRVVTDFAPELKRIDRTGKPIDNADGLFPRAQQFSYDTGAAVARSFGDMPALQGALLHTEIRDHTRPSFHDIDKNAYREAGGGEIPPQVTSSRGVTYKSLPDFPANRIVSDDNPILRYYRWFWKNGDGWNTLNSKLNDGLKSTGRSDLFTWFDPATRVPSIWGSGGKVDFLNQWTYTYPDPLKIGLAADELFAMAAGQPGQKVMNMTQIIWYREQTTKKPEPGKETEWEKVSPDAKFISIAPDHLSEALWLNIARPVQAIAYHGWGSMGDKLGYIQGSYVTTNLETQKRLKTLLHSVVRPLGPTLIQVPDAPNDVAFLESFSSQIFANRGTYGWGGGWGADSYMIARYAGLQPDIVYEETIQKKGLDNYKVLFLTDCDVLPVSVADAIKKFQQRGGIVIGDENLAPGLQPDILLPSVKRGKPDATKALLQQKAAELRGELDTYYAHPVESSNADVVTRRRRAGDSDYIFTVNDQRTYGDYVGQYGMVMEKGLPSQTRITLDRATGFVYDLMNHHEVKTEKTNGKLQFEVDLGAGEGNVFLVSERPVGDLQITSPAAAQRGRSLSLKVQLNDNAKRPLAAVVPLEITIRDPAGRTAEKSGFYGAANGKLALTLDIAPNDAPGKWQIEVREGLRGQTAKKTFEVR